MKRFFLIIAVAGVLANAPVAGAAGLTVVSKFVAGDIPTPPIAAAWNKTKEVVVPMSSQIVAKPRVFDLPKGKSSVRRVSVRSVNNGKAIAFLLEWEDVTENSTVDNPAAYRDAAALELAELAKAKEKIAAAVGHLPRTVSMSPAKADLEDG